MTSYKALAKSGAAVRALTMAAALSFGLSGCSLIQAANFLDKNNNKSVASQGERPPALVADPLLDASGLRRQQFVAAQAGGDELLDPPVAGQNLGVEGIRLGSAGEDRDQKRRQGSGGIVVADQLQRSGVGHHRLPWRSRNTRIRS